MTTQPQTPVKKTSTKTAAQKAVTPATARKALAKAVPPPKPAAKVAPVAAVVPVEVEGSAKAKKPKLVRDSFTIPKNEYEAIASLKERALKQGVSIKKSELLRAGLMTLAFMPDAAFAKALAEVPTLKTGRPATKPSAKPTDKKSK